MMRDQIKECQFHILLNIYSGLGWPSSFVQIQNKPSLCGYTYIYLYIPGSKLIFKEIHRNLRTSGVMLTRYIGSHTHLILGQYALYTLFCNKWQLYLWKSLNFLFFLFILVFLYLIKEPFRSDKLKQLRVFFFGGGVLLLGFTGFQGF